MPETTTERPEQLLTTEPVRRGFGNLRCPKCGEETTIAVDLDDFAEFICIACDERFSLDDVQTLVQQAQRWQRVLNWLATAPAKEPTR